MIKIGYFNFWDEFDEEEFKTLFGMALLKNGIEYEIHNCFIEECDLAFFSCFGNESNFSLVKGKPIMIYYTGESYKMSWLNMGAIKHADLSMSFYSDSQTNLYLPFWQTTFNRYKAMEPTIRRNFEDKTRFCVLTCRHCFPHFDGAKMRGDLMFAMTRAYKKVDSLGAWHNNTPEIKIPGFNSDNKLTQQILNAYKFNICFENNTSEGDEEYVSEKLLNAYAFGNVPVYLGGKHLDRFFNTKAFIDCNGKTIDEIIDIVKYYDTHDDEYKEMLTQPLLKNNINYKDYTYDRIYEFLKKNNVI